MWRPAAQCQDFYLALSDDEGVADEVILWSRRPLSPHNPDPPPSPPSSPSHPLPPSPPPPPLVCLRPYTVQPTKPAVRGAATVRAEATAGGRLLRQESAMAASARRATPSASATALLTSAARAAKAEAESDVLVAITDLSAIHIGDCGGVYGGGGARRVNLRDGVGWKGASSQGDATLPQILGRLRHRPSSSPTRLRQPRQPPRQLPRQPSRHALPSEVPPPPPPPAPRRATLSREDLALIRKTLRRVECLS